MNRLAVVGAGSWGTALALTLAQKFDDVRLWVHEHDLCARMAESRENDLYLPSFRLPDNVLVTTDLSEGVRQASVVLVAVPSHHLRGVLERILPSVENDSVFVSATKGIETGTLLRMSQVIQEVMGEVIGRRFESGVGVLSGPSFAREVASGQPAALVIASHNPELARFVQEAFHCPAFRLYTNGDPTGVEIGAALKNVVAIGAGICEGIGVGHNAVAALVTRGLVEITRLAVALGAQPRTLSGLAGLGDLVLTCTGDLSRNRRVGLELGRGRLLPEILASMRMVAEGVHTTYAAVDLADRHGIEMPIMQQMNAVLRLGKSPREAIRELMDRSLKCE